MHKLIFVYCDIHLLDLTYRQNFSVKREATEPTYSNPYDAEKMIDQKNPDSCPYLKQETSARDIVVSLLSLEINFGKSMT